MSNIRQKKKKRSKWQTAKRQQRKDQRAGGRGANDILQDDFDYMVRVLERWREPFEMDDERKIFVRNVFQTMEGKERIFVKNKLASRVIELILPHADISVLQTFTQAISEELRQNCTDQYCSHVLEKLLILCCFKSIDEDKTLFEPWVIKMCKFLCNNFGEFSRNTYASHLLRTCIECITGVRIIEKKQNQTQGYEDMTSFQFSDNKDLEECQELLQDRILQTEQDLLYDEMTSVVIQSYLKAMKEAKKKERLKPMLKFLSETMFFNDPNYGQRQSSLRLLEVILEASSILPKLFTIVSSKLFEGKLSELIKVREINFVVQRYFDFVPTTELFETTYTEISPHIEELINEGLTGDILSIVKASVRLKTKQTAVLRDLGKALHCKETLEDFIMPCIKLVPVDKITEESKICLHGSLVLQEILDFNKPIQVVRSLLSSDPKILTSIFSDRIGTHVLNRFVASETVGEKSRISLARRLSGQYVELACSKQGSFAVQKLWDSVPMKYKQTIVEELSKQERVLSKDQFGHFVYKSCAVSVFAHQQSEWAATITKNEKEKTLFKDIIGDAKLEIKKSGLDNPMKAPAPKELATEKTGVEPPKKKKKKESSYLDDL